MIMDVLYYTALGLGALTCLGLLFGVAVVLGGVIRYGEKSENGS
jgi:hypothetical protein